jgi:transposase
LILWSRNGPAKPLPGWGVIRARWQGAPPAVVARAHAGNQRLHARRQALTARKKRPLIANVAIARELAGWCWSLATLTS